MVSYILFCVLVGLGGACIGLFFNLSTLGLSICIIANCLLFIGASIGGTIAFARSLEATTVYHVCDGEHKVMLNLKFGAFSYTVNVPVTEYNCPNCMENTPCAPYPRDFGKGRKAMYVNVYGYEGKWTVPASKLRIAEKA